MRNGDLKRTLSDGIKKAEKLKKQKTTVTTITTTVTETVVNPDVEPVLMVLCIDASGSMQRVRDDTIGGVNSFLNKQRDVEAPTSVILSLFNSSFNTIYTGDLKNTDGLSPKTYFPSGATALYEAIHKSIRLAESYIERNGDISYRPFLLIQTDGEENASGNMYNKKNTASLIEVKKKQGWLVVFMGQDIDAFAESAAVNVSKGSTFSYGRAEIQSVYNSASVGLSHMRGLVGSGQTVDVDNFSSYCEPADTAETVDEVDLTKLG